MTAVHPRVCGEHWHDVKEIADDGGSSPRVRGTRRLQMGAFRPFRFIPACAGNTNASSIWVPKSPVHPRVCGEHSDQAFSNSCGAGSSPRVRGTHHLADRIDEEIRFIPACAGNTGLRLSRQAISAVHPRVCGEHSVESISSPPSDGSSPRVRGTLPMMSKIDHSNRFIPACAGNTGWWHSGWFPKEVHPRVCGEHFRLHAGTQAVRGSSPRVRGTQVEVPGVEHDQRFIPACAGNTEFPASVHRFLAVHPRVCGEHSTHFAFDQS